MKEYFVVPEEVLTVASTRVMLPTLVVYLPRRPKLLPFVRLVGYCSPLAVIVVVVAALTVGTSKHESVAMSKSIAMILLNMLYTSIFSCGDVRSL